MRKRPYRFHLSRLEPETTVTLDERESHHARDVLRLNPGDRILVFDDTGRNGEAVITETTHDRVAARVESLDDSGRELPSRVTLAAACPKGRRLDGMLQKLCELGAAEWVPLQSRRAQPVPPSNRLARMKKIVIEAAKQCGRGAVPVLSAPSTPEQLCASFTDYQKVVVAAPEAGETLLAVAGSWTTLPDRVLILVGPEGGFTGDEMDLMRKHGAVPVSLGMHVLRIETAAAAAMAVVHQKIVHLWNPESIS